MMLGCLISFLGIHFSLQCSQESQKQLPDYIVRAVTRTNLRDVNFGFIKAYIEHHMPIERYDEMKMLLHDRVNELKVERDKQSSQAQPALHTALLVLETAAWMKFVASYPSGAPFLLSALIFVGSGTYTMLCLVDALNKNDTNYWSLRDGEALLALLEETTSTSNVR